MRITKNKCYGCAVCTDVCPQKCITMSYDKYGFYIPIINDDKCIHCGKCMKVCPANNSVQGIEIDQIFKGYANDIMSEENQKSTSGAIFALIAKAIIDSNGVVFGVSFDKEFKNVSHVACFEMTQVDSCRGSKYIQSRTQGVYKQVDEQLKQGKIVLFSGTPCQIAALKSYLKVVPDNLFTVDFVCHGVGSTKFYQDYLKSVTKDACISHVGFRDKCGFYLKSTFRIIDSDNTPITEHLSYEKNFGKAFANNMISRESCGECKYATVERVADISLADNILFVTEKEKQYGSSLVFINTQKGLDLFELIKPNACMEQLNKVDVIPKIMHLKHPSIPHKHRKKLLNALAKGNYEKAVGYISGYEPKSTIYGRLKRKIKRVKRRIKKFLGKFFD